MNNSTINRTTDRRAISEVANGANANPLVAETEELFQVTTGHSSELAANVRRIQADESRRIEREAQEQLAKLREKARLD